MAEIKPEVEGMNIIFRGDFNPKIFQPAWFAAQGLVRGAEAEQAKIQIIHESLIIFSFDWLQIHVQQDRFFAGTTQNPYYEVLRDFVLGTFKILKHTPIRVMGINHDFHFPMGTEENWHELGHKIAPKELWKSSLEKPGLRSLSMEGQRTDGLKGFVLVRVEPSRRIQYGVYLNINDHYEIKDPDKSLGCDEIIGMLESSWDTSIIRAQDISKAILSL